MVHRSVDSKAYDSCLLRSKPPDSAGNHWSISHSSRLHWTKGAAPFAQECLHKYPFQILDRIFKPESWTNEKEKNLEKVWNNYAEYRVNLQYSPQHRMKLHSVLSLCNILSTLYSPRFAILWFHLATSFLPSPTLWLL